jgi:hypothetical protein
MNASERTSTPRRPDAEFAARRQSENAEILRARRLLDEDFSLERAWSEIKARGRAAASNVEALMYSLHAGGAALASPYARRRLSELSEAQLHEVSARLQKFQPNIARAWTPIEVESWSLYGAIYMDRATQVSIEALKRIRDERRALKAGGSSAGPATTDCNSTDEHTGAARKWAALSQ